MKLNKILYELEIRTAQIEELARIEAQEEVTRRERERATRIGTKNENAFWRHRTVHGVPAV